MLHRSGEIARYVRAVRDFGGNRIVPRDVGAPVVSRHTKKLLTREVISGSSPAQLQDVATGRVPNAQTFPPRPSQRPGENNPSDFIAWTRRYVLTTALLDALVGLLSAIVVVLWVHPGGESVGATQSLIAVLAAPLLWPMAIASARGYERRRVGIGSDEMRAVLRAGVVVVVVGAFAAGLLQRIVLLTMLVALVPIAVGLSLGVRFVNRKVLHRQQAAGSNVRNVIVVGSPLSAADLTLLLDREPHCGMRVTGVCVPATDIGQAQELGLNVLGDLDHVTAVVREFGCDAVAITGGDATRHNFLRGLAWSLEDLDVELLVHPGLIEVAGPRMHIRPYVGLPLLHIEQPHFTGWRRIVKRGADLLLTVLGLLVISPVLAAIAIAIKLQDGGPVFFRQARVGSDGESFTMYKFRSMVLDAEARLATLTACNEGAGPLFKMVDDPRITRLGKFLRKYSLDELPQLFNVLNGTMSLVGPRPPLQSEVAQYATDAHRRLLVKPGLTGLWQVSGRSTLSWEESVRLDLRYVENWTLTFDLLILWKTVFAVLAQRGAY